MPLQQTSGNDTADAYGGGAAAVPNYIEDVMSTFLYTGNGSTQTITNGIDLAGKGGLVWFKTRSPDIGNYHALFDTVRGNASVISSNATDAANAYGTPNVLTSFNSTGFSLGSDNYGWVNTSGNSNVSWTFRKQPKFFDVVTYTGTGSNRTIAHNLGSVPGCIIVKRTDASANWQVYHGSLANTQYLVLNDTAAVATGATRWNSTTPTSSVFSVGTDATVNASGATYVAYLFAHNAGGFGLTGTDNVISCGSYTGNGSANGPVINLGYEPQWVLIKNTSAAGFNWILFDNMRGMPVDSADNYLFPNTSDTENSFKLLSTQATGFQLNGTLSITNGSGNSYIYIAIRRGPMKTPTTGTSVLASVTRSGNSTQTIVTGASSPPDLVMVKSRNNATEFAFTDRLRGVTNELSSSYSFSEADFGANPTVSINMNGWTAPAGYATFNQSGYTYVNYMFSRYPNVFDEVCYTGDGSSSGSGGTVKNHNLGVTPELIIAKSRSNNRNWQVLAFGKIQLSFNLTNGQGADFGGTTAYGATASTFDAYYVQNTSGYAANIGGETFIAYLFATLAGVSKVGTYTGTGASQVINCGFTTGARWVMIKRTDSTGDWYVWDTARGMVSGTDPYMIFNDALAETNANYIFTSSTGFTIQSGVPAAINANGGTFLFLAIA